MSRPTLSLVLPIYNEEEIIPELGRRLTAFFDDLDPEKPASNPTESSATRPSSPNAAGRPARVGDSWEVIFVNDGSLDRSLTLLGALAATDRRFKVLSFARNFGHQMAITAGIDRAEGEAVVVMDADLQDPPEVVKEMLVRWREGFDVVYAVRSKRHGESWFKRSTAALFYRLLRAMLGGVSIPADAGDFRLMGRPVVLTMRALREQHRFVRGMVAWVGFRQTAVTYERPARFAGETKYPFRKMLGFAVDGITSFSTVPLRIAIWLGVVAGMIALAGGVWAIYVKLFGQGVVPGWTTIMILVSGGSSAQLLMTGILGEYVGRIYEEVKRRPLYVVRDEINLGAASSAPAGEGGGTVGAGPDPAASAGTRLRPPSDA